MGSCATSSPCRIELRDPAQQHVATVALVLLSAIALLISGLPPGAAVSAWTVAMLLTAIELRRRRRRPRMIELLPPDAVRLESADGRSVEARLLGWRRLGPWLLLELERDDGRRLALDIGWPGAPLNGARRLARQLARMRPVEPASV